MTTSVHCKRADGKWITIEHMDLGRWRETAYYVSAWFLGDQMYFTLYPVGAPLTAVERLESDAKQLRKWGIDLGSVDNVINPRIALA